jgi:hypothetical protein
MNLNEAKNRIAAILQQHLGIHHDEAVELIAPCGWEGL